MAHVACFVVQKEEFKPQIGSLSFVEITRRKFQRQQARLKAKKAEKKQEAAANEQQGTLGGQMQQLTIDEDALLEEAIKLAAWEVEGKKIGARRTAKKPYNVLSKHSKM